MELITSSKEGKGDERWTDFRFGCMHLKVIQGYPSGDTDQTKTAEKSELEL